MARYIVSHSREVIEAGTPEEVVRQLHASSRAPAESDEAWMGQAAARAALGSWPTIRSDSAAHFVADLLAAGLLSRAN